MVKHKRAFSVRIVFLRIRLEEHTVPTSLARSANLLYQQQLVAISDKKKILYPYNYILDTYHVPGSELLQSQNGSRSERELSNCVQTAKR